MVVISAVMDAERPDHVCSDCARLRQELQALREQVAKLTAALEAERRRGKRQAAPFSKGPPVAEPKPPGRKSGKRHGPHAHRSLPPRIDETYDVPLPLECPHCGGQHVSETHVAVQYQTEIPRTVIYRRFDVHVGRCDGCRRSVADRHAWQTSVARGATASQLGPNVHAVLTILNKELGVSHGKSVKLLGTLFPELRIARATSVRSTLRTAGRCRPAYEQLGCDLRGASEVAPDETGWRVSGSTRCTGSGS
jgi:transposase